MLLRISFIFSSLIVFYSCTNPKTEENNSPKKLISETDTFYGGKYLLHCSDTSQAAFESIFKANNDTSEANNLKRDVAFVKRIGDSLIFKLASSSKMLINKGSEADDFENYKYLGKINSINSYLVFGSFWESYSFILINANTGKENSLCGMPVVSPNNKHVVAAGFDLQAAFVFNGLQMYEVTSDSLKLNWSRELIRWGANNVAWLDNDNLMVEKLYVDSTMSIRKSYIKIGFSAK